MSCYIAFLRAINVGGRFVKMDVLRQQFEQLGLAQVQTYIQSGNVIFAADDTGSAQLEQRIEDQLREAFGFEVPTLLRTPSEIIEIAHYQPFPKTLYGAKSVLYISFLKEEPEPQRQQDLVQLSSTLDQFHVHGRQVYWLNHKHLGQSKFTNNKLEKVLKIPATRRNSSTVQKIVAKYFDA